MKTSIPLLLALSALCAAGNVHAEEGRFDAQVFRPAAAPRDLVMVQKSEVIGHFSPTVGFYYDVALNPLELVVNDTGRTMDAVAARLQLTALAGMGFFDLFDVSLAMPFIAWQSSDNLRSVGTEGKIETPALGDLRISTKYTIPYLNRKEEFKEGFGMAVAGNVNLPTGNENAFTSDGVVTGGATLITDYRFKFGLILATNLGLWLRPDTQFAGVRIGNMAQFGVAAEMYVVQRWGLSVIGEVYGYPSLTSFPDSPKQVPAEALLGIRWQTKHGITITFGGSFGAACGFGSPAIRFFNGFTFQPKNSREQEEINRLLMGDSYDSDHDGLAGDADKCPDKPGSPERFGCPDRDVDDDGIFDRDDECPFDSAGGRGKNGCPPVYIKDKDIVVLDPIQFAPDKDIILDASKPTLDEIARVLKENPKVREIVIEGHTDSRAGELYNMNLSQRRVHKVMAELAARGIEPARMTAKGFGQSELEYDDSMCTMPDEELTPDCRFMISKNRRIVFRIKRFGVPPPRSLTGAPGETTLPFKKSILPWVGDGALPRMFRREYEKIYGKQRGKESKPNPPGTLPSKGVLETKNDAVLGSGSVLPPSSTKDPEGGQGLKKEGVLPKRKGVLPNSGTPEAAPPTESTTPPKVTDPGPNPKETPRRPRRPRRHHRGSKK
ncbi:MAG: OmpA family protein [Polyangiaceae bacterium]|nr:OmpA family protein [Polyangiaceae bacterium]